MREEYERTQEYLFYFFNKDFDSILKRLELKKNKKFTDDEYSTLNAYVILPGRSGNKSGYSDPTGNKAAAIADINISRENIYNNHLKLYNTIKKVLNNYDQEIINILKAHLGVGQSKTSAIQAASFGKTAARKNVGKLLGELKKEMWPVFVELDKC
jgi:hypothetical protein